MGISYFFMSKWASFSDKKNHCENRFQNFLLVSGRKRKLKRPRFLNFEEFNINILKFIFNPFNFWPSILLFFLWKNCDHEVTSLAAHLSLRSFMHDLDKFVTRKNIGSISTFIDFPHSNDVSENPRDTHVADITPYVNSLEERLKDSVAWRTKEEMNMTIPGQETPTSRN